MKFKLALAKTILALFFGGVTAGVVWLIVASPREIVDLMLGLLVMFGAIGALYWAAETVVYGEKKHD